ncbi:MULTISPECIES: winged helix-turn-helix transcriptional regulator [Enterococcus]|uniref:winged helix-turn-helix transcriptional regulator n=1 Tax=Enterococcus TaxID=1350 RepID=UPI0002A2FE7D|nr:MULTISPECIES: helix-turn-helix domain-containing protein [Enterococcus]ELB05484.1 hypothetical protein OIG_04365 [Enterococcus faecium EnGen0028]MDT6323805.1 helix-turn-helix transcriptional regulator [Enterococcus faecium]HAQ4672468.1 helix-turn-helix transcriptional regulator [Enterococcus faecium]HAQ4706617.1 helix-turn-helix transcriptional regulator [Enterococcus faecium]HAR1638583.1 helix-turn-helix transcriptional regulator [Enterococcus faecium]
MNPLDDQICISSLKETMKIFSGKWTFLVVGELYAGTRHFNELAKKLAINTRSLTNTLRLLEENQVVFRKVIPTSPIQVEYGLTEKGRDFQKVFKAMNEWYQTWDSNK